MFKQILLPKTKTSSVQQSSDLGKHSLCQKENSHEPSLAAMTFALCGAQKAPNLISSRGTLQVIAP